MTTHEPVSRREFLKLAAKAGAVTGLGLGLGGLLSGCREDEDTPNTIATIGVDLTTTTTALRPTTTVRVGPETGRHLRIGVVSAATGPLALFGKADEWWIDFAKSALPDGMLCGDARLHRPIFMVQDSRSDGAAAAAGAATLVTEGKADILFASGPAALVNPVADQAESLGCPCLSSFVDWRSFLFGRGGSLETTFKWTHAFAFGLEDIVANFLAMWDQVETNKMVGLLLSDGPEAAVWTDETNGLPATVAAAGYQPVLPGLYTAGADYSPIIAGFIENGCELCCGAMGVTDFTAFWRQALAMDYRPKVVTISQALMFPQALDAIGVSARGITTESLWHPDWPYTDSITSQSAAQLAQDYMVRTGEQWTVALAQYACFEWAANAFLRTADVDDREALAQAIGSTRLSTCLGAIDFTAPVDPSGASRSKRPAANICKAPVGGAQWVQGAVFAFEPRLVSNATSPELRVVWPVEAIDYSE